MTTYRISLVQGRPNISHNRREFMAHNVHQSRMKDNVTLKDQTLEEAYSEEFKKAIEEYNETQKRENRKLSVKKYFDKIVAGQDKENNPKSCYELIIQLGSKETAGIEKNPQAAAQMKEILIEYFHDFEKRTAGHLHIVGAYIHMDESTPHLHLDYFPVASDYKKGLQRRNSLAKSLEQLGYVTENKKHNSTQLFQFAERNRLIELAKIHGVTAKWEQQVDPEKHLSPEMMQKLGKVVDRQLVDVYEKAKEAAKKQLAQKKEELTKGFLGTMGLKKLTVDEALESVSDLIEAAEVQRISVENKQAALLATHQKQQAKILELTSREKNISDQEEALAKKENELKEQEAALEKREKQAKEEKELAEKIQRENQQRALAFAQQEAELEEEKKKIESDKKKITELPSIEKANQTAIQLFAENKDLKAELSKTRKDLRASVEENKSLKNQLLEKSGIIETYKRLSETFSNFKEKASSLLGITLAANNAFSSILKSKPLNPSEQNVVKVCNVETGKALMDADNQVNYPLINIDELVKKKQEEEKKQKEQEQKQKQTLAQKSQQSEQKPGLKKEETDRKQVQIQQHQSQPLKQKLDKPEPQVTFHTGRSRSGGRGR